MDAPNAKSMAGYWIGKTRDSWPTLLWCPETIIMAANKRARLHPLVAQVLTVPASIPSLIPQGEKLAPPKDVVKQITKEAASIWRSRSFVT